MFINILLFILSMVLLIVGADIFVIGSNGIAIKLKIPTLVIGLTLVSIGTSLPELSVNVAASINLSNDIALGNIIGSNIFDIFIVIGVSACIMPLVVSEDIRRYDVFVLIIIYGILALFMFLITPGVISLIEGIILLILSIAYSFFIVLRNKDYKEEQKEENKRWFIRWYVYVILIILGLACLVGGGTLAVSSASTLARSFGLSERLIALTIISIGTSLPEVITSVVATIKKETDIAIGNAIGSCIFNVLLIIGISATINPISFDYRVIVDYIVLFISALLMLALARIKKVDRYSGIFMIILFIAYMAFVIIRG